MSRLLWIALAGALGAVARYRLGDWISERSGGSFPWGTLAINISGSFALGLGFTLMAERFSPHPDVRIALTAGFLGAYTTFSTFAFETQRLAEDGAMGLAAANVAASVVASLAAVWAGTAVARI